MPRVMWSTVSLQTRTWTVRPARALDSIYQQTSTPERRDSYVVRIHLLRLLLFTPSSHLRITALWISSIGYSPHLTRERVSLSSVKSAIVSVFLSHCAISSIARIDVGDWERMTVRTVNGVATQVDYHAHGATGSGTIPWSQVAKFDNGQRPVGWVAKGSHGFWASAGTFTYVNAVVLKLQDITSNGGVAWDTRDSLVSFRYPDSYTGAQSWLNYKGYWGNIGQTNCWWYVFHKECEIVTGPDGPVRAEVLGAATFSSISEESMQGTLSQVLGTTSTESTSSFTFYIDSSIHSVASKLAYTRIAVKQTCIPTLPTMNDAVAQASTTFATTPFTAASQFTISPKACAQDFSVTSYTVGVCADSNQTECVWGSPRALRAYSSNPSVHGVEAATAIIVSDLDNWRW